MSNFLFTGSDDSPETITHKSPRNTNNKAVAVVARARSKHSNDVDLRSHIVVDVDDGVLDVNGRRHSDDTMTSFHRLIAATSVDDEDLIGAASGSGNGVHVK